MVSSLAALWPTNYSTLIARTLHQALNLPANEDASIASRFASRLMPLRSSLLACCPCLVSSYYWAVEHPRLGTPGCTTFIDSRASWTNAVVLQGLYECGARQIVVVASGFDSKAYRLRTPFPVTFYEVDMEHVIERKRQLCDAVLPMERGFRRPIYIAADLSKVSLVQAMRGSVFNANAVSVVLIEGLLYYLPIKAVHVLLQNVSDLMAPGSRVAFDFVHQDALDGTVSYPGWNNMADVVKRKNEVMQSGFDPTRESMQSMLESHGLSLVELLTPADMLRQFQPHLDPALLTSDRPPICPFFSYVIAEKKLVGGGGKKENDDL